MDTEWERIWKEAVVKWAYSSGIWQTVTEATKKSAGTAHEFLYSEADSYPPTTGQDFSRAA